MKFYQQGTLMEARGGQEFVKATRSKRSYDQGKVMEQYRRIAKTVCHVCGSVIVGTSRLKFCSNACKQKNKRAVAKHKADTLT